MSKLYEGECCRDQVDCYDAKLLQTQRELQDLGFGLLAEVTWLTWDAVLRPLTSKIISSRVLMSPNAPHL